MARNSQPPKDIAFEREHMKMLFSYAEWQEARRTRHDSGSLSGGVHPSAVGAHVLAEIATPEP
jgi:hypothetical protein